MNVFSLTHLNELEKELPDPKRACAEEGYSSGVPGCILILNRQANHGHRIGGVEAQEASAFAEFEIMMCKDTEGVSSLRWVLRGLVVM